MGLIQLRPMQPSFLTLFKRGRFWRSPSTDEESTEREHRQIERYCVSGTAFCFKHDSSFRQLFLKNICGLSDLEATANFQISIEPYNWADLLIQGNQQVFVIEFKVNADLEDHQNPDFKEFNSRENSKNSGGYGWEIRNRFQGQSVTYIVVGADAKFKPRESPLRCYQKEWKEISGAESSIVNDLYDCLEEMGIDGFAGRHMTKTDNQHLCENLGVAALMLQVLQDACVTANLPVQSVKPDIYSSRDLLFFGLTIGRTLKRDLTQRLKDLVQPVAEDIGWFGYERSGDKNIVSVWMYCGNADAMKHVYKRWRSAGFPESDIFEHAAEPNRIRLEKHSGESDGDKEFLVSALKALLVDVLK